MWWARFCILQLFCGIAFWLLWILIVMIPMIVEVSWSADMLLQLGTWMVAWFPITIGSWFETKLAWEVLYSAAVLWYCILIVMDFDCYDPYDCWGELISWYAASDWNLNGGLISNYNRKLIRYKKSHATMWTREASDRKLGSVFYARAARLCSRARNCSFLGFIRAAGSKKKIKNRGICHLYRILLVIAQSLRLAAGQFLNHRFHNKNKNLVSKTFISEMHIFNT